MTVAALKMKLTVAFTICLVLFLNFELSSSQPVAKIKTKNFSSYKDRVQARQSYNAEDDYYNEEEEDAEEEDDLQQSLNEQNYDGSAGGHGEGGGAQELEDEDDNEDDEGEEDDEERFMENSAFLREIFDIL